MSSGGGQPKKAESTGRKARIIAGIGASAGGITALQSWFETVPTDLGVAYVIVVHLSPQHRSELASNLGSRTKMPVTEVVDLAPLEPDHVYVIPPNRRLQITDSKVVACPFEEPHGSRAPIDDFFRSLAATHGDGFAILLSGGGSDGSVGLKSIKEHGGLILVQDPKEAEFSSMPQSAIATRLADLVLPVRKLANRFVELVRVRIKVPLEADKLDADDDKALNEIVVFLRGRTGHDFTRYKRSTLQRRLARRLQMSGHTKLREYLPYLRDNAEEVQALFDDLLITVATFFRDRASFEALEREIVPKLFDQVRAEEGLRVWVPGCATGEEAYSLIMLLLEEAGRRDFRVPIKVFGSDLDEGVLATAREGLYPDAIAADASEQRLQRFFTKEASRYRVRQEVRDCALFATHSLLRDPPFSRLDLVSCRNLMIYMERDLQKQVLGIFHYSLRPRGYLFLGSSESVDGSGLFRVVHKEHRIFQALEHKTERALELSSLLIATPPAVHAPQPQDHAPEERATSSLHREALEALAPPSILVDENYNVLHVSETAGRFLLQPGGEITSELIRLVRPELQPFLRSALFRALEKQTATLSLATPVSYNGTTRRVCVLVQPQPPQDGRENRALVIFLEGEMVEVVDHGEYPGGEDDQVDRLREELRSAQEQVQITRESYDTTVEELQAANEELQTVNSDLGSKLDEISRAHSDLQNLMVATDLGTLFLDLHLNIKRFTPRLVDIFSITPSDAGRPITDFTHQLDYSDLARDARLVIQELTPVEREVGSHSGRWYLIRFRPYRTIENKIDGVVVTFVDITERKTAEQDLRASQTRLAREVENMRQLHQMTMRVITSEDPQSALRQILSTAIEVQGADFGSIQMHTGSRNLTRVVVHQGIEGAALEALGAAILEPDSASSRAVERGGRVAMGDVQTAKVSARYRQLAAKVGFRAVQATALVCQRDRTVGVLAIHFRTPRQFSTSDSRMFDLQAWYAANLLYRLKIESDLKDLNETLEQRVKERTDQVVETAERFRALIEASAQTVWTTDTAGVVVEDSPSWRAFTGQTVDQWLAQGWIEMVHPEDVQYAATNWRHCIQTKHVFDAEFRIYHSPDDDYRWVHLRAVPLFCTEGETRGWVGMGTDVTDSKRSATQLRALAASLTLAEEKERRRIAHILHDDLQQLLFGIQLRVKSMVKSAKMGKSSSLAEDAEQAVQWLSEAIEKTRGLSMDLSPPLLEEDEDFGSSVRWLAQRMKEVTGLQAKVRVPRRLPVINADTRVRLFQILRELLFNVAKHSGAENVEVSIRSSGGDLTIVVTDSGKGFDVAAAEAKRNAGMGLFSVRDRLSFFGGHMEIESAPGKGTVATISVPLDHATANSHQ